MIQESASTSGDDVSAAKPTARREAIIMSDIVSVGGFTINLGNILFAEFTPANADSNNERQARLIITLALAITPNLEKGTNALTHILYADKAEALNSYLTLRSKLLTGHRDIEQAWQLWKRSYGV